MLLTSVGGRAFGNADECIDAMVRALAVVEHAGLDIRLVTHHRVHDSFQPSLTNSTAMEHNPMGSDGRWPPVRCTCTGRVAHVLHFGCD